MPLQPFFYILKPFFSLPWFGHRKLFRLEPFYGAESSQNNRNRCLLNLFKELLLVFFLPIIVVDHIDENDEKRVFCDRICGIFSASSASTFTLVKPFSKMIVLTYSPFRTLASPESTKTFNSTTHGSYSTLCGLDLSYERIYLCFNRGCERISVHLQRDER